MWRSLVAHLVWDQGVQGSNPCTPTINLKKAHSKVSFFFRDAVRNSDLRDEVQGDWRAAPRGALVCMRNVGTAESLVLADAQRRNSLEK